MSDDSSNPFSKPSSGRYVPTVLMPGEGIKIDKAQNETMKVASDDVNGEYFIFEGIIPPQVGVPLHTHKHDHEIFYVLEGDFLVQSGDVMYRMGPGSLGNFVKTNPHSIFNAGFTPGKALFMTVPGAMQGFFERLDRLTDQKDILALATEYGTEFMPPGPLPEPAVNGIAADDAYAPLLKNQVARAEVYAGWRGSVRKNAARLAAAIAQAFNERGKAGGPFPVQAIDAAALQAAFEAPAGPFELAGFDRLKGAVRRNWQAFDLASGSPVEGGVLRNFWQRTNHRIALETFAKKITSSGDAYYDPAALPGDRAVDLVLNFYRPEIGLTSWGDSFAGGKRHQRTAFAYRLPGAQEVLWFVKEMAVDGMAVEGNTWTVAHEWQASVLGKSQLFTVSIPFAADLERGEARVSGDRFRRASYEEA